MGVLVGLTVGVGDTVGVALGVGVLLGLTVGVGDTVGVALGVGVLLGLTAGVGDTVGVALGVAVRAGDTDSGRLGVAMGDAWVKVAEGPRVCVGSPAMVGVIDRAT